MSKLDSVVAPPNQPPVVYPPYYQPNLQHVAGELPRFEITVRNSVLIPLLQSLVDAVAWGLGAFVLGGAAALLPDWPADKLGVRVVLWLFAALGAWLTAAVKLYWPERVAAAQDSLLQRLEPVVGRDLNGDGVVGARPVIVHGRQRRETVDEVVERQWREDVEAFVNQAFELQTTGEKKMLGLRLSDARTLTQERYNVLRDAFIRTGWAHWRNPDNPKPGWTFELGATPEAIVRGILDNVATE